MHLLFNAILPISSVHLLCTANIHRTTINTNNYSVLFLTAEVQENGESEDSVPPDFDFHL